MTLILAIHTASDQNTFAQETSGPILPQFPIEPVAEPVLELETVPNVIDSRSPAFQKSRASGVESHDSTPSHSSGGGYWIVSARHCPQSGVPRCTPQQLQYFRATSAGRLTCSSFAAYKQQIDASAPICFVVHGSYSTWKSLVEDSDPMNRWLRSSAPNTPLQVVFFTWPSEPITAVLPTVDVGILGRRASFNGFYLSQLIQETPDNSRISFFAHSHGARVVAASLELLDGGALYGYQLSQAGRGKRSLRPIFAAAAIDHHWLNPGERFGRAMNQVDKGLVLYNERDLALMIYPLRRLFSHRPLGLVGFDRKDRQLQNGRAKKLTEINVTRQIRTGHLWSHYHAKEQIAQAMHPFIRFEEPQSQGVLETNARRIHYSRHPPLFRNSTNCRRGVIRESSSDTGCIPFVGQHGTMHK